MPAKSRRNLISKWQKQYEGKVDRPCQRAERQIADYIRREFGLKRKKKFMQEVDHTVRMLMQSPGIGPIEPLFADRPKAYRSVIINGLNKLVYYVAILLDFRWQDAIFCFEATSKVAGGVETT